MAAMPVLSTSSIQQTSVSSYLVSDLESCSASLRMEDSVDHLEASVIKRRLVEKMASKLPVLRRAIKVG